jgi:hypothetical protein
MRYPRMTENEALSGMLKLFDFIEKPAQTNAKELSKQSGLSVAKISILTQEGILECSPVKSNSAGRKFEWKWAGYRPNIHMAKALVEAVPNFPSKCGGKAEKPAPQEQPKAELRSSVLVHKTFEITKSLNGERATLRVDKKDGGAINMGVINLGGPCTSDYLKCWGFAMLTAASEVCKEEE